MKKYILQLVLSIMTITAFISCNDVLDHQTSNRICEVRVSLADQKTRVGLVPSGQWGDMIAKWQDGDKLHIILTKGENVFDLGNIPVREISEDGKNGVFQYALPEELENADYYILSCFTSNCEPKIADGDILYQASIIREPINDYKARVMFSQMVTGDNPFGVFNHYGTYELLHITNKSDKSISFSLNGFNAETRWYKETGAIRLHDKSFITDLSFKKSDKSPSIKIPANSSDIIVSWYIPNGQTIKDAGLVAEIDGKNVKSSNTISSEVTLCTGIAYHMYATWDGKELKFGKGDVTTPSIIKVEPTEIDFGEVKFGGSKTEYFTVSNIGKSKLTFSVSETHGTFDIPESGKEFTLEAGKSKKFSVKFSASGDNIKEGTTVSTGSAVRIFSDAENGTQYLELIGRITKSSSEEPDIETFTVKGVSFNMVKVEGGSFMMGSPDDDPDAGGIYSDETPQHKVTLDSYYIGETEVTQKLWKTVMGSNPSIFQGDNLPVEEISWDDSQVFIKKLNALTGKKFRLPTEAEWEYAARGGQKSNGYKYAGSNDVDKVAWNCNNSNNTTHTVGTKEANELGLYDMSGNVWEWCQDWYGFSYYKESPVNNPCNTVESKYKIHRGGSIEYVIKDLRVAMRGDYYNPPSNRLRGLRIVLANNNEGSTVSYLSCPDDNHPHAIDLGLPSGTLWACCNVGASKPEGSGNCYAWGEIEVYEAGKVDEYGWPLYKWVDSNRKLTKYNTQSAYGIVDNKTVLESDDDVASVKWGSSWSMPTKEQCKELIDNTTHTEVVKKSNWFEELKSKTNGATIILWKNYLHIGNYWTSSLYKEKSSFYAWYLDTDDKHGPGLSVQDRSYGYYVRPVCKKDK